MKAALAILLGLMFLLPAGGEEWSALESRTASYTVGSVGEFARGISSGGWVPAELVTPFDDIDVRDPVKRKEPPRASRFFREDDEL